MMLPQRQPGESRESWLRRCWDYRETVMRSWRDQAAARAGSPTVKEAWAALGWEHVDVDQIRAHALGVKL